MLLELGDSGLRKIQYSYAGQMRRGDLPAAGCPDDLDQLVPYLRRTVADALRVCAGWRNPKQGGEPGENNPGAGVCPSRSGEGRVPLRYRVMGQGGMIQVLSRFVGSQGEFQWLVYLPPITPRQGFQDLGASAGEAYDSARCTLHQAWTVTDRCRGVASAGGLGKPRLPEPLDNDGRSS